MATLSTLKLVTSKKHISISPVQHRRNKLISKVQEQIDMCEAKQKGLTYAPKHLKNFTNKETGERMTIEAIKRVKEWFWVNDAGKINLAIKYGSKTLMLNKKGANAIELSNGDELISTLKNIKVAITNGELDDSINEVSNATKLGFGK
jgi:hypothetical protein